jgi:hypothetical protein
MSETSSTTLGGTGAGSTASSSTGSPTNAAGTSAGALYGPSGERLSSGWRQNRAQSDQIGDFVMQQPMTAALVALVVGYFLGKLT